MNQSIFVCQRQSRGNEGLCLIGMLIIWLRKYPFCIKSFGSYKRIEMHFKHTVLAYSNVVSQFDYHNEVIHKMLASYL